MMRSSIFLKLALIGFFLPIISVEQSYAANKLAFVVGINEYTRLGENAQLRLAVNDADSVGETLGGMGFSVTKVTQDARIEPLLIEFTKFVRTINYGDIVVFFFAGHGISLEDGTYLMPADVPPLEPGDELRAKRSSISEKDISEQIRATGARAALVVLDACRNNPFPPRGRRSLGNSSRGLSRLSAADGVFTLYSAREGQTALDQIDSGNGSKNSIFTSTFIKNLKRQDISVSELGETVRDEVAARTRSAGHDQVPAVYNDLIGARTIYLARPRDASLTDQSLSPRKPEDTSLASANGKGIADTIDQPAKSSAGNDERAIWSSISDTKSVAVINTFLSRFPNGQYVDYAKARRDELEDIARRERARLQEQEDKAIARLREQEERAARERERQIAEERRAARARLEKDRRSDKEQERGRLQYAARVDPPVRPEPAPALSRPASGSWFVIMGSYPRGDRSRAAERLAFLHRHNIRAKMISTSGYDNFAPGLMIIGQGPFRKSVALNVLSTAKRSISDAYIKSGSAISED